MTAVTKASPEHFTASDGVKLHYLDQGTGPAIVLLPGWTQPASGFAAQLEGLSFGFRCPALDWRGHGEPERPAHGCRVSRLARDCPDLLDCAGLNDAVLLGHLTGCTVIWSFIDVLGQDRIRALVLCDEMLAFIKRPEWSEPECRSDGAVVGADEALSMAATLAGPDGESMLRRLLTEEFSPGFPKADIARVIEGSLKIPRGAAAELMHSVMQVDFRSVLPLIRRPTLCVGEARSHLGPEVMPWIAACIPGAKAVMLDARHFVHLESPVEFNAAVLAFLQAVDGTSN
jgi:non-heme chloroperoxidase